jgi:hypothetical protein
MENRRRRPHVSCLSYIAFSIALLFLFPSGAPRPPPPASLCLLLLFVLGADLRDDCAAQYSASIAGQSIAPHGRHHRSVPSRTSACTARCVVHTVTVSCTRPLSLCARGKRGKPAEPAVRCRGATAASGAGGGKGTRQTRVCMQRTLLHTYVRKDRPSPCELR